MFVLPAPPMLHARPTCTVIFPCTALYICAASGLSSDVPCLQDKGSWTVIALHIWQA